MVRVSSLLAAVVFVCLVALVALAGGQSASTGTPATSFQILTGFSAKETCSCVFAVQQTDDYCTSFGQQSGYAVDVAIDHTARTVASTFAGTTRTARAGADGTGCTLDSL